MVVLFCFWTILLFLRIKYTEGVSLLLEANLEDVVMIFILKDKFL